MMQPRSARRARDRQRGSALVLSLFAVFLVAALAASFLHLSTGYSKRQSSGIAQKRAFYLAEAGLTESVAGIFRGRTGTIGSPEAPARFGDGLFYVEGTDLGDDLIQLDASGMHGGADVLLSLVVERGRPSVAHLGMFGSESLTIEPGTLIDGYESASGPYASRGLLGGALGAAEEVVETVETAAGDLADLQESIAADLLGGMCETSPTETWMEGMAGMEETMNGLMDGMMDGIGTTLEEGTQQTEAIFVPVGSNGPVTIEGTLLEPTHIEGHVTGGIGRTPSISSNVTVAGDVETRSCSLALPPLAIPEIELEAGISVPGGFPELLAIGAGQATGLESLTVAPEAELIVQGPGILVLGSMELGAGSSVQLDPGDGTLDVYVLDGMAMASSASITVTNPDPLSTSLLFPNEREAPIELIGQGEFHGLIYAPESELHVGSAFEVFGSLVARNLTFLARARYHFDTTLADESLAGSRPRVVSWRVVEMAVRGEEAQSVYQRLGIAPEAALLPADSHEDQFLEVRYRPHGSFFRTNYAGSEQAFDWGNVAEVDSMSRDGEEVPKLSRNWWERVDWEAVGNFLSNLADAWRNR